MFVYKYRPADFRVRELADFPLATGGPYAVYTLAKTGVGTLEAVAEVRRALRIEEFAVSFGGLKDAQAETEQTVTILDGPRDDRAFPRFRLYYRGQAIRPFVSEDLRGNAFEIVLRNIQPTDADLLMTRMTACGERPFPNYFDDQRFGSRGKDGGFVAEAWCHGDFPKAVSRALAALPRDDMSRRAVQFQLQRQPSAARGAFRTISADWRALFLSAFQSWLWNRWLDALLRAELRDAAVPTIDIDGQPFATPAAVADRWIGRELPLPAARQPIENPHDEVVLANVLLEFGLTRDRLRIDFPRDSQFRRGFRKAFVQPTNVRCERLEDELHAGRQALRVWFDLPSGAYATVFLKIVGQVSNLSGTG